MTPSPCGPRSASADPVRRAIQLVPLPSPKDSLWSAMAIRGLPARNFRNWRRLPATVVTFVIQYLPWRQLPRVIAGASQRQDEPAPRVAAKSANEDSFTLPLLQVQQRV